MQSEAPLDYTALSPVPPEGRVDLERWRSLATCELELEVGFGRGSFLLERAAVAPFAHIIGVEIKRKWAYKVDERRQREHLGNATVWGADVRALLPRLGPDGVLRRVFVNFPDPWWKKRHHKRMVLAPDVIDELARLLMPSGELFIQTDVEERALHYRGLLANHLAFDIDPEAFASGNPYQAQSNREKRAAVDGLPVYRILATRR